MVALKIQRNYLSLAKTSQQSRHLCQSALELDAKPERAERKVLTEFCLRYLMPLESNISRSISVIALLRLVKRLKSTNDTIRPSATIRSMNGVGDMR